MPEESHFHQKVLLTLSCFLCAHCSMERPCCECHVYLALRRQTRRVKTFPYDARRQEIRSVEKADRGAAAAAAVEAADGELNALPGCNVSRQSSSGIVSRTTESGSSQEYLVPLNPETRPLLWLRLSSRCARLC